jgi:hypothetical protein
MASTSARTSFIVPMMLCASLYLVTITPLRADASVFFDDFNRPDSPTVGNGWLDLAGNLGGNLGIRDNRCSGQTTDGTAGIYRPFAVSAPVTISATLFEQNGFGDLLRRYTSAIAIANNGVRGQGYGLFFYRGDENFDNSSVVLFDGATQVDTFLVPSQFDASLDVNFTIHLDGSVQGTVDGMAFSFGAHSIQSAGSNVAYWTELADSRSNTITHPRMDEFMIVQVPEPTLVAPAVLAGAFCLRRARRARVG